MSIYEIFRKINWFIIPYLVLLCLCLIVKLLYTRQDIYFTINSLNFPLADTLAPYATDIGNGWTAIAISAIFVFNSYRKAFLLATAYAVTSILAQAGKFIFDAPRPKLYFKDQLNRIHFVKGVDILSIHSFPSGHTVTAFSMAVLFTYFSKNKAWGILYLFIAMLVGYSRMYLSEHFFEDVLAGSVIGTILTIFWVRWMDSRAFLNKESWQQGLLKNK